MCVTGVLAPLQFEALGSGSRALERGRGWREGACPDYKRHTGGTGANGIYGLDQYTEIEMKQGNKGMNECRIR